MSDYDDLRKAELKVAILESFKRRNWFWNRSDDSGERIVEKYGVEAVNACIQEPEMWKIGYASGDKSSWYSAYNKLCSRDVALEICCSKPEEIKYFSMYADSIGKDKSFVLDVIEGCQRLNGDFLSELSTELKKDKDVVLAAVRKNGANYAHSSKANAIRNDLDIIKAAITSYPEAIKDIPFKFKLMKEIAMITVSGSGVELDSLDFFQDDREVVMAAVKNHGEALNYASIRLRNDREVSSVAVKSKSSAMKYVPEHFLSDLSFCLQALECKSGFVFLKYCDIELRCDKSFVQMAIEHLPQNYAYASRSLKMDRDIYEPLIKVDGAEHFKLLPYELRNKPEIVSMAIEKAKQTYDSDVWGDKKEQNYQEVRGAIFQSAGTDVQKIIVEPTQLCSDVNNPTLERAYDKAGDSIFKVDAWRAAPGVTERQQLATERLNTYLLAQRLTTDLAAKDGQDQSKPKRMKI